MNRITVRGSLDRVGSSGLVEGWCWSPEEPDIQREVILSVDGIEVATFNCDMHRGDLLEASFGDGCHAFSTVIPLAGLASGEHRASLRDATTGLPVGKPVEFVVDRPVPAIRTMRAPAQRQPEQRPLEGHIDELSEEGLIVGWSCNHANQSEPVTIAIAVDGEVIGTTLACLYRPDLVSLGDGQGRYGFRYVLPWSAISGKGSIFVQLVDVETNLPFGQPKVLRRRATADIQQQIAELDRSGRALASQVEHLANRLNAQPNVGDIFRTVAEFFNRFADNVDRGAASSLTLGTAARSIIDQYSAFTLRTPQQPVATILVEVRGTFRNLYECLFALHDAGIDEHSRIVLIDDGVVEDAILLNSVVRGLDYRFVSGDLAMAAARNELLEHTQTDLVVFASSGARPSSSWLAETLKTFEASRQCGVVTPRILRDDGLLHHAYFEMDEGGDIIDVGRAALPDDAEFQQERRVPAAGGFMLTVRRDALEPHIALQPQFETLSAALFDLCYRIRENGKSIIFQPSAIIRYCESEGGDPSLISAETAFHPSSLRLLAQRWRPGSGGEDVASNLAEVPPGDGR